MFDFALVAKAAVMLAAILPTVAAVWWVLRKIGLIDPSRPLRPLDLQSWTLPFMLGMAACYAPAYVVASHFTTDSVAVPLGVATSMLAVPVLATLIRRRRDLS